MAAVEELSYRFCGSQAAQGIAYTEVRYSPHLLLDGEYFSHGGSDPEPALAAVTRGLRRGCEEHQIVVNQIICCISFQPKWSLAIIDLAEKYRSAYPCAVVGVDVAAGEVGDDPVGHAEAFARAQALKLPVTLHAEVCPTSSQETGAWRHSASSEEEPPWPSHPLRSMLEAGASVSINSDDPSVFLTTLSEEFWGLLSHCNKYRQIYTYIYIYKCNNKSSCLLEISILFL